MSGIAQKAWALPVSCLALAAVAELALIGLCFAFGRTGPGDSFMSFGGLILILSHLPTLLLLSIFRLHPAGFLGWFAIGMIQFFLVFWCVGRMWKRIQADRGN